MRTEGDEGLLFERMIFLTPNCYRGKLCSFDKERKSYANGASLHIRAAAEQGNSIDVVISWSVGCMRGTRVNS